MLVEHTFNGMIAISDIVDGYLVRRCYMGYTVKEAKRLFRQEVQGK